MPWIQASRSANAGLPLSACCPALCAGQPGTCQLHGLPLSLHSSWLWTQCSLAIALTSSSGTLLLPQNAWRNPNLRGQWAKGGGGQLAQEERALLDAYGRKKK